MTAAELAKKMKQDEDNKKQQEAERRKKNQTHRDLQKEIFVNWIINALTSFNLTINKKWFAGNDYWTLSKNNGKTLISCVLSYERGTWDPSDDCRGMPYEGWEIAIYPGSWTGPHDNRGMDGITTQDSLMRTSLKL